MNLLHIDSSASGANSASRQLSGAVVQALKAANPDLSVIRRDLDAAPVAHLDSRLLPTIRPDPARASTAAADEHAEADAVLAEFLAADVVVIGAPMYNFTIPTQLKAWFDRILVAGKTFAYTAEGPKGLAGGKRVIVVSTRGGLYTPGAPAEGLDFQETYLRAVLGFIGIDDVEIVRAEGLAFGPEQRSASVAAAHASIPALAASFAPALAA
ncbi:MAG TPA: NAD(P)H-dependent oxidoreductase [Caulobacteraceae bacterium]|nr:NAD(P)H-dependent oxidoreductase [Caulobacteraceae bacterium]